MFERPEVSTLVDVAGRPLRYEAKSASASEGNWFLKKFVAPNTVAGEPVTAQSAMRVTAVARAVIAISAALGTMPAKLYQRNATGKEVFADHPAHRLIHRRASDYVSAGALRRQLTQDALLHGNGYAIANRAASGRVVEFLRVSPTAMTVEADDFGNPTYRLTTKGGVIPFDPRDVLHLPALFSFDGIKGEAPIKLAREGIGASLVMEKHGIKLFSNGARPSLAVSYPADATQGVGPDKDGAVARKNLIAITRASLEGVENSGKAAVLFDGAQATPFTFSSVDSQFLELRRLVIDEIARAFGIPPHILFEMGRATWGNSEEMGRQFVQFTLLPWIEAWQDAYTRCLLDPEADDALTIEFVVDDLLRADTATRATAYAQYRSMGVLTANEVRAFENWPSIAGGDVLQNPYTTTGAMPAKDAA